MPETSARLAAALADRYTIERELGAGGMATVYLANDLKHDRKVALKVLKPELAAILGGERFLNEIKVTANLQHPNILALYDSGEADSFLFYVMPLVEGDTLRDKLDREKQLGVDEALEIAKGVAAALDYAHEQGIIHRDIKPENVLLQRGQALVADFGIALAVSHAGGTRLTETGLSLGTPHYMSPEQAMGDRELDARSDVYSLGAMLYEMLVGEPPHLGNSVQAIIAKIVTSEPELVTAQRSAVPQNVAAAVHKALSKHPADRFGSAAAFSEALGNASFTLASFATTAETGRDRRAVRVLPFVALTVLFAAVAIWALLRPTAPAPVIRYGLALPTSQAPDPAIAALPSPDGSRIVYAGGSGTAASQLWVKERDSYAATPLAGTLGVTSFIPSPDGEWVAFSVGGRLKKIPVAGGAAITLADGGAASRPGVIAWLDDGSIVYLLGGARRLGRVPDTGGENVVVWSSDTLSLSQVMPLPGGRGVLFQACAAPCADPGVWALDLRSGEAHSVVAGALYAQYLPMGQLVYVRPDGAMLAVPFDVGSLQATGAPIAVLDSVAVVGTDPLVGISQSGMLLMRSGSAVDFQEFELVWVDQSGSETAVDSSWTFRLTNFAGNHGWRLSPDGRRLAIGLASGSGDDIWIKQLPRGPLSRVSFDAGAEYRPRWASDGQSVIFGASRGVSGLYRRRADGTGADSLILEGMFDEGVWSPDGSWILLRSGATSAAAGGRDIVGIRPGVDTVPVPVLATSYDEEAIELSPDGRWMAYQSDETGRTEIFIRPFPDVESGKHQVSNGGGEAPLWARNGRELYYLGPNDDMMAATITFGASSWRAA